MKKHKKTIKKAAIPSFLAGVINGLLGTGGGVPLYFYLSKNGEDKEAYATASVGILFLSLQTLFLYRDATVTPSLVSPVLPLLAVIGGALGGWLLGKMDQLWLKRLFGLLLLLSGCYLLGKEICFAIS